MKPLDQIRPILFAYTLIAISLCAVSCNSDKDIPAALKPEIILDGDGSGIYTVKTGNELTIAPEYKNVPNAAYSWRLDGRVVCTSPSYTAIWAVPGDYYITLKVSTDGGEAVEDIKVMVLDETPPIISLPVPEGGFTVKAGADCIFAPRYIHDDLEPFTVEWYVDDVLQAEGRQYAFNRPEPGVYNLRIVARNADGDSDFEFMVTTIAGGPHFVEFPSPLYFTHTTERYTFAGRTICLTPYIAGFDEPSYKWSVNGEESGCSDAIFAYTPARLGEYTITVTVSDTDASVSADVKVVCVAGTEAAVMRPKTGASSPMTNNVFEYLPAPGQFINEPEELRQATWRQAADWALKTIKNRGFVSLGAYGGYVVVGFDHSIAVSGMDYDFIIEGNAFKDAEGDSNEPGVVWVMQDVNGNGLPDDEWYQLKGSEYDTPSTLKNHSVTYYRPVADGLDVDWTAQDGSKGSVEYLGAYHDQPSYYPSWIKTASYTLTGTKLKAASYQQSGKWVLPPMAWGYADNLGSDSFEMNFNGQRGQFTGFKISNAVMADGRPANLSHIDFIKVQSAVMVQNGWLGETSTDVLSLIDYSMTVK